MNDVLALRWYNLSAGSVGFVALTGEDPSGKWFKVYVGFVMIPTLEDVDAQRIAQAGMPIGDEQLARVLAPMCADREYRH